MQQIITKCAAAEQSDPLNPCAPLLRAKALKAQLGMVDWDNNAREAARLIEKAIALKGDLADDPVAHYRLARLYLQLGKKEKATAEFALHARLTGR